MPSSAVKISLAVIFAVVVLALIITLPLVLRSADPFPGECGRRIGAWKVKDIAIGPQPGTVIGGYDAQGGEFPWHTDLGGCGGTIIDSYHIITAAHCVYPNHWAGTNNGTIVYAGNMKPGDSIDDDENAYEYIEYGNQENKTEEPTSMPEPISMPEPTAEQRLKVIQVQSHACYCGDFSSTCPPSEDCPHERDPAMNDIALLTTEQPFKFDEIVQPICLPEKNEIFKEGDTVWLSGFGRYNNTHYKSAEKLQGIGMPIISQSECEKALNDGEMKVRAKGMVCAGKGEGIGGCHGDSGGPLISFRKGTEVGVLVGVVSWGSPDCDKYGVYSRVTNYVPWIKKALKNSLKHDR